VGKDKPKAPEMVTGQSQLTAGDKATIAQQQKIQGIYGDIAEKAAPMYSQYLTDQGNRMGGRINTASGYETQANALAKTANVLSPEFQAQLDKTIGLQKEQAQKTMTDIYQPQQEATTADIYKRLGGMNSSIARDILGQLEQKRTATSEDLARSIELDRQRTEQQQLANQASGLQQAMAMSDWQNQLATGGVGLGTNVATTGMTNSANVIGGVNNQATNLANAINSANSANYNAQVQANSGKLGWKDILGAAATIGGAYLGSDINIKKNIKLIGADKGINIYQFEYLTDKYNELPTGKHVGVMAQEIQNIIPDAVMQGRDYLKVDYNKVIQFLED